MPNLQQNRRDDELPEFPFAGPFGGVQSECPSHLVERYSGFADCVNMMFRKGECRVRPALNPMVAMPDPQETWVGIADFFASNGVRHQMAFTPTRLLEYTSAGWVVVPNPVPFAFSGTPTDFFSWSVVGQKLAFSQGIDKIGYWDGISASFAIANDSVPARYMAEIANHLLVGNTIEAGSRAYQRLRWCGAGDVTDWISFNAGQTDLFNDLGPINGIIKLFQSGYIFQQLGIVQAIPSGLGTRPFYFNPLSSRSKGLTCPRTLAAYGETVCAYVGKDNVYSFDGTSSNPIGDMPAEGRGRLGARRRIFADLAGVDLNSVFGFVSTSINGNDFNAYWLCIPSVCTWIYNFDEQNWTRWTWNGVPSVIGTFNTQTLVRICDLIGPISQQLWTPASMSNANPFDSVFVGFGDGSLGIFDFTGWSEKNWYVDTGQMPFGDMRHSKTTKRVRVVGHDYGKATFQLTLTSENGQVSQPVINGIPTTTIGDGSGLSKTTMLPVNLPANYTTIRVEGEARQPFAFSEVTPMFDTGGEITK